MLSLPVPLLSFLNLIELVIVTSMSVFLVCFTSFVYSCNMFSTVLDNTQWKTQFLKCLYLCLLIRRGNPAGLHERTQATQMNHYGLLQTMSSANKNTKYNVELSYGETILIKRNRGPIDTMGQQKNLKSLQNVRHNLRNLRKIRKL